MRTIQGFHLDQLMRDSLQFSATARQYCLRPQIKSVRNAAHFVIDRFGRFLTVIAFLGSERKSQKLSIVRSAVRKMAKQIAHAEPHHDLPYKFGRALEVIRGSG